MPIITKNDHMEKLSDKDGLFKIVAIDHRVVYVNSLREGLKREPSRDEIVESKIKIIRYFNEFASSFLIDYDYCIPSVITSKAMGNQGFMVGIEGDDYSTINFSDKYLNENVTVQSIKNMGGSAVKLFLYYNPFLPQAKKQEQLIASVSNECSENDIPFLLEPILYTGNDALSINEQIDLMKLMLKRLSKYDIDIYKILFPGDIVQRSLEENIKICEEISSIIRKPWIVLSSGCELSVFKKQLELACKGGASGFAIGRTLWDNYLKTGCRDEINGNESKNLMLQTFRNICEIASTYGASWRSISN